MLFKIIACLLITYGSGWVHGKPYSDRYDYSDQSHNYPHYGPEPITTSTTTKPLYPTLYPQYQPSAPTGPFAPSAPQPPPYQRPGSNPYNVTPLPPNNHGLPYNNNYPNQPNPNNNFNRPYYDNTRTTYPPFVGTTIRPTFPTRQPYNTPTPGSRISNGTIYHSGNTTHPPHNYNNNPHGRNPNQNNPYDPNKAPHSGNYNPNYDNRGTTTYRPFPNAGQMNQHGNQNPNQPNSGYPQQNITPNRPNTGNPFPSTGNQYPIHPTYNPNSSNQNQGAFMNPNDFRPSQPNVPQTNPNQRPDISSSGVALAPFPDVNSNNNGGRNQFNNDNSQNRPITNDPNSRYNNNNGNVPLAGYTGAHVPLA